MQYSFWPTTKQRTRIPRLPLRPPNDYLREALSTTLEDGEAALEMRVQVQTDAHRMPLENAGILWPERLSPRVPVATLRLPRQKSSYFAQLDFARKLTFNPWHCIAEHRPLGNQGRARRAMYAMLAAYRQSSNAVTHYEPTGEEVLD